MILKGTLINLDSFDFRHNIFLFFSVFEAFGPIIYCKLAQGSSAHKHKGYGFIEYETNQAAMEAIASMNLFDLGGQYLRVGRAITPPNALMGPSTGSSIMPTATAVAAAAATAKIQALDAVASNAMALGLSKLNTAPLPIVPTIPVGLPGIATIPVMPPIPGNPTIPPLPTALPPRPGLIPPPGLIAPQPPVALQPPRVITPVQLGVPPVIIPPVTVVTPSLGQPLPPPPVTTTAVNQDALRRAHEQAQQKQQEELQKKLLEETEPQTLQQQENMSIKGQNARHLVMQKLMRKMESRVIILRNMVGPEDVDETLQEEIQEECSKYGVVDRVIIYNEKQSDNVDDDAEIIVKIFVEFSQMSGKFESDFNDYCVNNFDDFVAEAESARDALNGRYFGGRMVKAQLYDQALFDHSDFSA